MMRIGETRVERVGARPGATTAAVALAGTLVAFGGRAAAQVPSDTVRLEPIVVTATRLPISIDDLPVAVTVLEGDELEARGIRYLADALREVPGLSVARTGQQGGNTVLFLRGGESDYVKVLVDGVAINDPGGAIDLADLTTAEVERVEIVRGPVSVLYGSDAVSGVVQIFTRQGGGRTRGSAALVVGSRAALQAGGRVVGQAGPVRYALDVAGDRSDGLYAFNSAYGNTSWHGTVRLIPDPATDGTLVVRYGASTYHYPTDATGRVEDRNAEQDREQLVVSLEIGRRLTRGLAARASLAASRSDLSIDDRPDGPGDTIGFYGYRSARAVHRRSAEVRLIGSMPAGTTITAGAELEGQEEESRFDVESQFGPSTSEFAAARRSIGSYLQVLSTPISRVTVTTGGRLDDNDAFGTFVSYRAGASVELLPGTRVRGSVGSAFKEPTFYESHADDPFARGNPNLRPERTRSWEVGVRRSLWSGRIEAGLTYFDQRFRDLIQYTLATPEPDDPTYFNVAAADARGVEFEATVSPGVGLTVGGAYTYLYTAVRNPGFDEGAGATFVPGERLLRRPTHLFHLRVTGRLGAGGSVTGSARYVGARADRDFSTYPITPVVLGGYALVDLSLEVPLGHARRGRHGLRATLRVENLLDVEYQEVFGFPAPGRTVLLGVRVDS